MNTLSGAPIGWLLVFALVGISLAALLSAGEAAVVRVTRTAVGEIVDTRSEIADRIQRLVVSPGHTAASAAFVRVFAEMLATACITVCVAALVDPWWLVLLISVVVGALVALVLVRISPRTIGRRRPAQTLVFLSTLLDVVLRVTDRKSTRLNSSHPV